MSAVIVVASGARVRDEIWRESRGLEKDNPVQVAPLLWVYYFGEPSEDFMAYLNEAEIPYVHPF